MVVNVPLVLDLPDVRVLKVERDRRGYYVFWVESTLNGARCHVCGEICERFCGYGPEIELRHLPILGTPSCIRICPKRYQCLTCPGGPTTSQQPPWYERKSPHTRAYEQHVLLELINSTMEDVSRKLALGYGAVMGVVNRWIEREVDWATFERLEVLGLDEIAMRKGHRDFVTIVTARAQSGEVSVLGVLKNRDKATVKEFLQSIPERLRQTVKTVCCDLYTGFSNAAAEVFTGVRVVADRFHVTKLYRGCADTLRKQEQRRLKRELPKEDYDALKGVMWTFRKDPAQLSETEKQQLQQLFEHAPRLGTAWRLSQQLTAIFENRKLKKSSAACEIRKWEAEVRASGLTCFDSFLGTLETHRDQILNYFVHRENSGFVEGLNNKIKVLKRRCYGLLIPSHLFQRLTLDLYGYALFAPPAYHKI